MGGAAPSPVHARVITATNRDPEELLASGRFREDLLYRLNVINIHLPALRERRDDVVLLAAHFLRKHAREGQTPPRMDDAALTALTNYFWPGNVRELENVIERAVTLNPLGPITIEDLSLRVMAAAMDQRAPHFEETPQGLFEGLPSLEEIERRYLQHVLHATDGNRTRAAEILDVNRKTLYRMAARLGIDLSNPKS